MTANIVPSEIALKVARATLAWEQARTASEEAQDLEATTHALLREAKQEHTNYLKQEAYAAQQLVAMEL